MPTLKPLVVAITVLLGLGVFTPGPAQARPTECHGTLGACAWEVEPDADGSGLHWFLLDCGDGGRWHPISAATATAYCSQNG